MNNLTDKQKINWLMRERQSWINTCLEMEKMLKRMPSQYLPKENDGLICGEISDKDFPFDMSDYSVEEKERDAAQH
jgi:hypothetical protein